MKKNKNLIDKIFVNEKQSYNLLFADFVKKIVCSYYDVDESLMNCKIRRREVVKCRQISMYLLKKHSNMSLTVLGGEFGKDHATVLHAVKTINNYLDWDKDLRIEIQELEKIVILKSGAMLKNYSIEKDFYFIDLSIFLSIKTNDNRSLILTGYSEEEAKEIMQKLGISAKIKAHFNKGMYVLEKHNENEENKD
jgi:hypothetical protein